MRAPIRLKINGTEETFPLPEHESYFKFPNDIGLTYQIQAVRESLLAGI